jgi:hypothetical protein
VTALNSCLGKYSFDKKKEGSDKTEMKALKINDLVLRRFLGGLKLSFQNVCK